MALYEENSVYLYNSLSRKKEKFEPLNPPHVGLYVCGPTVYNHVHLGNCRTFISFDTIYRYLTHLDYKVRYVRNITDAGHLEGNSDEGEDKIGKKARLEQLEPMEIVQRYTLEFHKVMEKFNTHPPSIEPTATGHIVEQINVIQKILEKGLAYQINGSVYFDVEKYNEENDYGKLSGHKIEELINVTRELDRKNEKHNPLDFALWKKASPSHIMRWKSPWGEGFPGWHLECSVMSTKYLGDQFDIHGGGMDLKFPHHECEIAQNRAANDKDDVRYWVHGNMLTLNGAPMSKSTENTLSPQELFMGNNNKLEKSFSPSVARFFMMQAHYRSQLDFSNGALLAAEKGFQRLMEAIVKLEKLQSGGNLVDFDVTGWRKNCYAAMNDDFNSPILISHLFEAVKVVNGVDKVTSGFTEEQLRILKITLRDFVFDVLGLVKPYSDQSHKKLDGIMQLVINIRAKARTDKNWALSDQIRNELAKIGIQLKDRKKGTVYNLN